MKLTMPFIKWEQVDMTSGSTLNVPPNRISLEPILTVSQTPNMQRKETGSLKCLDDEAILGPHEDNKKPSSRHVVLTSCMRR